MSDWALRSAPGPDGSVVVFRERPKPGAPHILERIYENPPDRFSSAGTLELVQPGERPRFRSATPMLASSSQKPKVRMTRRAFRDLEDAIYHSHSGRLETAGALFGWVNDGVLTIREATLAVLNQRERSCSVDNDKIRKQEEAHRLADDGLLLLGTWHTEPGAGDVKPSRADLEHWVSYTRAADKPFFIGMTLRKPNRWHLGWRGVITRAHVFARTDEGIDCATIVDLKENSWTL